MRFGNRTGGRTVEAWRIGSRPRLTSQLNGHSPRKKKSAPAAVTAATAEYLKSEDSLLSWIEECCATGPELWDAGNRLWKSWCTWCDSARERPGTRKAFAETMKNDGYERKKESGARGYTVDRGARHRIVRVELVTECPDAMRAKISASMT